MQQAQVSLLREGMGLSEGLDGFLSYLLPGNTRISYGKDLRSFVRFLDEQSLSELRVDEISGEHIKAFRDYQLEANCSNTCRRRLSALRSFFSWAVSEGLADHNPAVDVPMPRRRKSQPMVLSKEEVYRIISAADPRRPLAARDRAMISLCYYAGLRASELCSMTIEAIRWEHFKHAKKDRPAVVVDGKGGKTRAVPLHEEAEHDLTTWMSFRPAVESRALFVTKFGNPVDSDDFREILKKYVRLAGIDKEVTPHTLRHSFATHLIQNNTRIDLVSQYLGHENISSTAIYLHISDEEYADGVDNLPARTRAGKPLFRA